MDKLAKSAVAVQILEPKRAPVIKRLIQEQKYFTHNVSFPDTVAESKTLYLIGYRRGQIDQIALGIKTGRMASVEDRIRFKFIQDISPISYRSLLEGNPTGQMLFEFLDAHNETSINQALFGEIIEKIVKRQPELEGRIDLLIKLANGVDFPDERKNERFLQEKDAIGILFKMISEDASAVFDTWDALSYEDAFSYLESISHQNMHEAAVLFHDRDFFDGWPLDSMPNIYTRTYVNPEDTKRLSITIFDKTKVETSSGIDLAYYDEYENSFVLLQYKMMRETGAGYAYYPLSDGSYYEEIEVIGNLDNAFASLTNFDGGVADYRVAYSPFFFKFCRNKQFEPLTAEPIAGAYVPLDLWRAFCRDVEASGNFVVSEKTLPKYISPRAFVELVKSGMVGTQPVCSDMFKAVVAMSVQKGRTVVMGVRQKTQRLRKKKTKDETD